MTSTMEELIQRARAWIASDPDPVTARELHDIVERRDEVELAERMAGPLAFGTAGLRGVLGAGESRMNRAVVIRTCAGLAAYLLDQQPGAREAGVVVGFDGRHGSRAFAEETARVLAGAGVTTHLFAEAAPTPLAAFAVTDLGAAAGVMVTASHNPPEYNGYKVYWSNGAQIIPPHDEGIAAAIGRIGGANEVDRPTLEAARRRGLLLPVTAETLSRYRDAVSSLSLDGSGREEIRIVYTAMHGVGDPWTRGALERFGFRSVWSVPEQRDPDPDFSTVTFPNPEEPGALDLAFALAREKGANLVIANDPDADRLAVAIPSGDGFRQLTGNEVGALLADYVLRHGAGGTGPERLVVTTMVSSPLLGEMARDHGVGYAEVLTGFKWIATAAMEREERQGARFVFGYEEALGYTVGTVARDKDGVSAAAVFAELAAVAAAEGRTIDDELERLARTHGLHLSRQRSVRRTGLDGAAAIRATMDRLRESPPERVGDAAVLVIRDVQAGTRTERGGARSDLDLPRSNVLAYDLEGGARVIARPSGTEPKIKFYFDLREEVGQGEEHATARARALSRLDALEAAFLEIAG